MKIALTRSGAVALTVTSLLVAEGFHPSPQPETVSSFVGRDGGEPTIIEVPDGEAEAARALLRRNGQEKWLV